MFQAMRVEGLSVRVGFQIPSFPPGWQARLLACGSRASCLGEPELRPQGAVGVQWAKTP